MIVIDTSALVAILNHEPERTAFYEAIAASNRRLVSAVSYQEASQVLFALRGINGLYRPNVAATTSLDRGVSAIQNVHDVFYMANLRWPSIFCYPPQLAP